MGILGLLTVLQILIWDFGKITIKAVNAGLINIQEIFGNKELILLGINNTLQETL